MEIMKPRELWIVDKPDGTGTAVFIKEHTARLYMEANDIGSCDHVIEKSAYDETTKLIERLASALSEACNGCVDQQDAFEKYTEWKAHVGGGL